MTVPGMVAVDKLGRRPLLIWGAVIMYVPKPLSFQQRQLTLTLSQVCVRVPRCHHWCHDLHERSVGPEGAHRPCVYLHRSLRLDLGPARMGRHRRNLPTVHPCEGHVDVHRF
jgi:hypothetical protein